MDSRQKEDRKRYTDPKTQHSRNKGIVHSRLQTVEKIEEIDYANQYKTQFSREREKEEIKLS